MLSLLLACASPSAPADSPVDSTTDSEPPAQVQGSFRLLNAQSGKGKEGIALSAELGQATTDAEGVGTVPLLAGAPFEVRAEGGNLLPHLLHGEAGSEDFELISFVASENLTNQVLGYLGSAYDPATGIVVVGLDTPDLAPATGSGASLDVDYELAFVFGATLPEEGTTLVEGGSSIVSFVGVPPGQATVTALPAEGQACAVFPAVQAAEASVTVEAGVVSVLTFTCE